MGRLAGIETPYIDSVLGLIQQRARMLGLYPTFPGPDGDTDEESRALSARRRHFRTPARTLHAPRPVRRS